MSTAERMPANASARTRSASPMTHAIGEGSRPLTRLSGSLGIPGIIGTGRDCPILVRVLATHVSRAARSRSSAARLVFEPVPLDRCDWGALDALEDRVLFQTREWLEFLRRTQDAAPVVAALRADGETVGWFTGAVVRRFGVRILGS